MASHDGELNESEIVRAVAKNAVERTTRRVIRDLQRMTETLSGMDSELKNMWDEVCVQIQDQGSVFWDAYDETVRGMVSWLVVQLSKHERDAIWLQTDAGFDWSCEEPEDREAYPVLDDDIINYLVKQIYIATADWSNNRIEGYMARSTPGD